MQIATADEVFILDFRVLTNEHINTAKGPNQRLYQNKQEVHSPSSYNSNHNKNNQSNKNRNNISSPNTVNSATKVDKEIENKRKLSLEELKNKSRMFLSNLMQDEGILKVGWAFNNEDIKMLRANNNGKIGWF